MRSCSSCFSAFLEQLPQQQDILVQLPYVWFEEKHFQAALEAGLREATLGQYVGFGGTERRLPAMSVDAHS